MVEPRGVCLALREQRLWPHQVPDRQTNDGGDHDADDDGRVTHPGWTTMEVG
jgi:hypothetical protein